MEAMAQMEQALDALAAPAALQSETSATLQWLLRVSKDSPTATWVQHFGSVLNAVLELMVDPEPLVREQALRVLAELLKNQVSVEGGDEENWRVTAEKLLTCIFHFLCSATILRWIHWWK